MRDLIEIRLICAPQVPAILRTDPIRLRQVLINLIGNSIKFTNRGEVSLYVHLLNEKEDTVTLQFDVNDSGIGIPAEKLQHLFDAFNQGDGSTTRQYGGTGLGLTIARKLVQMMGGEIGVESKLGKGSRFWFTAKLQRPFDPDEDLASENVVTFTDEINALIIDGHESSSHSLSAMFTSWNCRHLHVTEITRAGEEIQQSSQIGDDYNLIIVDQDMAPQFRKMFERFTQIYPEYSKPICLIMIPFGNQIKSEILKEQGFDDYLTKPIKQSQLHDTLMLFWSESDGKYNELQRTIIHPETKNNTADILLVEDNKVNQHVGIRLLQKLGFTPDIANNGKEAIEALSKKFYDLVLMDVQMPVMDGIQATHLIRSKKSFTLNPEVPIIAMTANVMAEDRTKCTKVGMNGFVGKPVRKKELEDTIRQWISA